MSTDVFRRVGRGGAGNWYSKKDMEDAEKSGLAAQKSDGSTPSTPAPQPSSTSATVAAGPVYARSGRGGAGNFYDAEALAAAAATDGNGEAQISSGSKAAAATASAVAVSTRPKGGLSGRGGAGNWSAAAMAAAEEEAAAEDRRRKQAALEAQIRQDVEAGLPMPPRAYQGPSLREGEL